MHLNLPTLKYTQLRGDMIQVYKTTHNIYNSEISPNLRYYPKSNTRDNKYKLLNYTFHYDLRKYASSARIVNIWNSLPNTVVDFTADLTVIGDRSLHDISILYSVMHICSNN